MQQPTHVALPPSTDCSGTVTTLGGRILPAEHVVLVAEWAAAPFKMLTCGAVPGRLPDTMAHSSLLLCRPCSERLQLPCQAWSRSLQLSKKTWWMSILHPPQPKRADRVLPPLSVPADVARGQHRVSPETVCIMSVDWYVKVDK